MIKPGKWSREWVIKTIQRRNSKGLRLDWTYINQNCPKLFYAAKKHFKSWAAAVNAIGIDYQSVSQVKLPGTWSKKTIIESIKELNSAGTPITSQYVCRNHSAIYSAACDYFGSWGAGVRAAGFDYSAIRLRERGKWTKNRIIEEISLRAESGKSLCVTEARKGDKAFSCLITAAQSKFGTWRKAVKTAGYDDKKLLRLHSRNWTRNGIIREIRKRHKQGKSFAFRIWSKEDFPLYRVVMRVFKSRARALRAAGIDPDVAGGKIWWNKSKVIRHIRKISKSGESLASGYIMSHYHGLYYAGVKYFGSWKNALKSSGYSFKRHTRHMSTVDFLRDIDATEFQKIVEQTMRMINLERKTVARKRKDRK